MRNKKAIDELAGVENMEQDEEGEDVQLEEGELVTSKPCEDLTSSKHPWKSVCGP